MPSKVIMTEKSYVGGLQQIARSLERAGHEDTLDAWSVLYELRELVKVLLDEAKETNDSL